MKAAHRKATKHKLIYNQALQHIEKFRFSGSPLFVCSSSVQPILSHPSFQSWKQTAKLHPTAKELLSPRHLLPSSLQIIHPSAVPASSCILNLGCNVFWLKPKQLKTKSTRYLPDSEQRQTCQLVQHRTSSNFCFLLHDIPFKMRGKSPARSIQRAMVLNSSIGLPVCYPLLLSQIPWLTFFITKNHHSDSWVLI